MRPPTSGSYGITNLNPFADPGPLRKRPLLEERDHLGGVMLRPRFEETGVLGMEQLAVLLEYEQVRVAADLGVLR